MAGGAAGGGAAALGLSLLPAGVMTGFAGMALLRRKNAPPPPAATVQICQGDRIITLSAVVDTGNRALDPWTAMPVVFVSAGLFPGEKGRPMAIRTAAGERAVCCFTPDAIAVDGQSVRAAVALAPDDFLDCALVPPGLCAQRRA
ncbi:MAG: sigma-E processing peptidase SpoIIGA [Oscillospiraceae bacterium]|nr:sigma-E processing peptidase SpoIIGA [Oscillospiraceae bacterium]